MTAHEEKKTASPEVKKGSPALQEFQEGLSRIGKPEEKVRFCLDFMRSALSDHKAPCFRDFWEGKRVCLPFFKEALAPGLRAKLWAEYIEISQEGRQLKEMLEEQSSFAAEQIELAITGLEADLDRQPALIDQIPSIEMLNYIAFIARKKEIYDLSQRELQLLNTFAARVNSLRKELIKTEMRIRHKTKLFDRLSKAGDRIFPRRKELIQKVSSEFISDVKAFQSRFEGGQENPQLFELRDDIKALQSLAKDLTLDTRTFTETRLILSQCWDSLKEKEKERRQEVSQKKELYDKNAKLVLDKIKVLEEKCLVEACTFDEAMKLSNEIMSFMKTVDLGRLEVANLKDAIQKARSPVTDKLQREKEVRERQLHEIQKQKQELLSQLKIAIEKAIGEAGTRSIEELNESKETLTKQLHQMLLTSAEKEFYDQLLKQLRDRIIEKREQILADLPLDQRRSLEEFHKILIERKAQRQEIRAELENYRKMLAGSGFDFEKAMRYREMIDAEKVRLDRASAAIEEIEEKIAELEE